MDINQDVYTMAGKQEATGILETIKSSIQPDIVAQKMGIDRNVLIDIGLYGLIGIISGFLLKKYSEYFISLALFLVILFMLNNAHYITITLDTVKIHDALGLKSIPVNTDAYGSLLCEWVHSHVFSFASLIIGFLIGLKIS